MGMFDTIICNYPLPNAADNTLTFQTKSLENVLGTYEITADGRLLEYPGRMWEGPDTGEQPVEVPFHGDIVFYEHQNLAFGEPVPMTEGSKLLVRPVTRARWVEYRARFTEGRVTRIEVVEDRIQENVTHISAVIFP